MVTRGNVAIYCYNALTAQTWDVTESTNGQLTSSNFNTTTILEKYFSDFVNEKGDMKLVEGATVMASGALTGAYGINQIRLDVSDAEYERKADGIVSFLKLKENVKNKEEKTYYTGTTNEIVAYVPSEVADIASLNNKTVDVIFGRDNKVAYIAVTDDSYTDLLVTAWKYTAGTPDTAEIEIDGVEYDFADAVEVSVFGAVINTDKTNFADGLATINQLLVGSISVGSSGADEVDSLDIETADKNMTKNVVAEFILDEDEEIKSINFKFSADYTKSGVVAVDEYIVEKISSKDVLTVKGGSATETDLEKLEDKHDPRVIRNGEIASLADIVVGDVITEVTVGTKVTTLIVTANTVEGLIKDYTGRTNTFNVDGEKLVVSNAAVLYNTDGEVDKYSNDAPAAVKTYFKDEDATLYLNFAGEVVAVVAETNATGTVLGVVTNHYDANGVNEIFEDENEVEYAKIRILTANGENKTYKIYNDNTNKNVTADADYTPFGINDIVSFEADSNKVIKASKIKEVEDGKEYKFDSTDDIVAKEYATKATADSNKELIDGKKFTSATKVINYNSNNKEIITNFDAVVKSNQFVVANMWMFTKGNKIIYIVASIGNNEYGTSTAKYGILLNTDTNENEDGADYVATLLVDGVEETYECSIDLYEKYDLGDIIAFTVSDNEINYSESASTSDVTTAQDVVNTKKTAKNDADALKAQADAITAKISAYTEAELDTEAKREAAITLAKAAHTAWTSINAEVGETLTEITVTKTDDAADVKTAIDALIGEIAAIKLAVEGNVDTANTELESAIDGLLTAQSTLVASTTSLVVAKDYVEDLKDVADETALPSTNITQTYFNTVIGYNADYIKVVESDEDSIVFENKGAQVAFLAEGYIIYNLADGVEVNSISQGDYVLLTDYDATDDEYGIVIIVK